MIIVKNRELLIPNNERYLGTNYDTGMENRVFRIPRYSQSGTDLSDLTFKINLIVNGEPLDRAVIRKTVDDDYIYLTWTVTAAQVAVTGTVFVCVTGNDTNDTVKWSTFMATFYTEKSLGDDIDTAYRNLINKVNQEISDRESAVTAEAEARSASDTALQNNLSNQIAALRSAIGSPLKASTASEMTDTNKIYVYTGSETGMTAGNWYYYDGSNWISGGVYNAIAMDTDKTLQIADMAADAKSTGDNIGELENAIAQSDYDIDILSNGEVTIKPETFVGGISPQGVISDAATNYRRTSYVKIPSGATGLITNYKSNSSYFGYAFFTKNKEYISGGINNALQDTDRKITLLYEFPVNAEYIIITTNVAQYTPDITTCYITFVNDTHNNNITSLRYDKDSLIYGGYNLDDGVITIYPKFINGSMQTDGTLHNGSIHYQRTDFIMIPFGTVKIVTNLRCSQSSLFGYSFYDEDKTYISGGTLLGNPTTTITSVPVNARYIICGDSSFSNSGKYIKFYSNAVGAGTSSYNHMIASSGIDAPLKFSYTVGKCLDANFDVIDLAGYALTDPIAVDGLQYVTITNTVSGGCRYVFYDANGNKVHTQTTGADLEKKVLVPLTAKTFRIAFNTSQNDISIVGNGNVYAGKNVSIIGDSISTYDGYIVDGYVTYYPHGTLNDVSYTWWHQVITAMGMQLLRNASWSGSSVCGQTGDTTGKVATSNKRISDLASGSTTPDIIFVYIGTNDWGRGSYILGDFSSTSEIPGDGNILNISNAYAKMLYKIRTTYPNARLICLTELEGRLTQDDTRYPVLNAKGNSIHQVNHCIMEIAHIFGAEVVDLDTAGANFWNIENYTIDSTATHPNITGHRLIARRIIEYLKANH